MYSDRLAEVVESYIDAECINLDRYNIYQKVSDESGKSFIQTQNIDEEETGVSAGIFRLFSSFASISDMESFISNIKTMGTGNGGFKIGDYLTLKRYPVSSTYFDYNFTSDQFTNPKHPASADIYYRTDSGHNDIYLFLQRFRYNIMSGLTISEFKYYIKPKFTGSVDFNVSFYSDFEFEHREFIYAPLDSYWLSMNSGTRSFVDETYYELDLLTQTTDIRNEKDYILIEGDSASNTAHEFYLTGNNNESYYKIKIQSDSNYPFYISPKLVNYGRNNNKNYYCIYEIDARWA